MSDQQENQGRRMGRPSTRTEPYRRTSMELPVSQLTFLENVKNRTEWVVQAIQKEMDREKKGQS